MGNENQDIAIVGIACRFPEARNKEQFWDNMINKKNCISEIPRSRFDWSQIADNIAGVKKSVLGVGGFIENVDAFDADFFGISAKEAECMDPQQRLLLELAWACFEDSGHVRHQWWGKNIGVFVGVTNFDYKELQEDRAIKDVELYYATATAPALVANRVSYFFNLKGPSIAIDVACSSSLNAVHLAVQSINQGESALALVGGISLLLSPTRYASLIQMGILSPSGFCKTFDDDADGYIRSEGAGMVLLKPLSKAIEDGDNIYGVLKGSAVNHSGKAYTLTYPSSESQACVIIDALNRAKIHPYDLSYIELHGTGTPKGDPIEFEGLCKAFNHFQYEGLSEKKLLRTCFCKSKYRAS